MIRYEDISAAIQVRHLQVQFAEALTFGLDDPAPEAAARLASRGFDQAPVMDGRRVLGIVLAKRLTGGAGIVGDRLEPIDQEHLVSADAPVSKALAWLRETPCLFVLAGREITGFFVQADLNKQPARTYFYLLVASIEAGLADRIRAWAGRDEPRLAQALPPDIRGRVLRIRREARLADADADLVSFLMFPDILRVAAGISEVRHDLGGPSEQEWTEMTAPWVGLRNAVMHPTSDLVGRGRKLDDLVHLDEDLRGILTALEPSLGLEARNEGHS